MMSISVLPLKLLDQIVNEEIKQVFFPVVENISIKERFKLLQYFFQAAKESPDSLIQDIITRDFNQISLYTKACAIVCSLLLGKAFPGQEIIASIFHPNQLIRESAAYVLNKLCLKAWNLCIPGSIPDRLMKLVRRFLMSIRESPIYCSTVSGLLKIVPGNAGNF